MQRNIDDVFDLILDEINQGKSIEEVLKMYPEFADELAPLLRLAMEIKNLPKPEPSLEKITVALDKVNEDIVKSQSIARKFSLGMIFNRPPALVRTAAVVLLIVLVGWSSLAISSRTVPGDLFYPVKIAKEQVLYVLTFDEEGKVRRHLDFSCQRTEELKLSFRRNGRVNQGLINAMLDNAQASLAHTDLEKIEEAEKFVKRIDEVTLYQIAVLEEICRCGCRDTNSLYRAIEVCSARHEHIQNRLNQRK